jgi:hypothetical protein
LNDAPTQNDAPLPGARKALEFLSEWGLLLLQDSTFPSLVGLIAGETVRGSWWGHPKGSEVFHAAGHLADHQDVLAAKLISGKVTFVHRRLWPLLIAIGRAKEPWQLSGLTAEARSLLTRVDRDQHVRATGKAAKQLEMRLLVASEEVHTDSGAHAIELMTWQAFARRAKEHLPRVSAARARGELDALLARMNAKFEAKAKVPW